MNKAQLIEAVKLKSEFSKKDVTLVIETLLDTITDALANSEKVALVGFGSFETRKRAARTGRNPQDGSAIEIPETKVPAFKAGKALKEAVK